MDNQNYKDIYKKYLELRPKILGAARIAEIRGEYDVMDSGTYNEFVETRNKLEPYLEFLSNDELSAIFMDPVIGSKAGAILDERTKMNYPTKKLGK